MPDEKNQETAQCYDPVKQYGGAELRIMAFQAGREMSPLTEEQIKTMGNCPVVIAEIKKG